MTPRPGATPPAARGRGQGARLLPRLRHEYVATLALGAAGAVLVLLAVRQGWARVVATPPAPLPATSARVSGQSLVPVAGALGVAALAGLAAVIATRRLARRLTGLLLAAFGVIIAVAVSGPVTAAEVAAAARSAGGPANGPATAGGGTAGAAPALSLAGHVTMTGFPWRLMAVAGALMIVAAGLAVLWRGGGWPAMSGRYEQSAGRAVGTAAGTAAGTAPGNHHNCVRAAPGAADENALWESLSAGMDPTDPA